MADEDENEEGTNEGEGSKKKGGKKKLIIIVVAVLLLAGGAAFMFLGGGEEKVAEEDELIQEEKHLTEVVDLGSFIVNLSQNATFLKVKIMLECDGEILHGSTAATHGNAAAVAVSKFPGVLGQLEARVKDNVIKVLSSKKAPEVLNADGKEELREELLDAINEAVETEEPLVTELYFTEFIIQ
ncbi:MAG: flagellar basal body-associated FliL family protein [Deltaproteobacteria bacterium]|nr:flagellar basal body-associated FliL family protein [Deltaproteobacteria bacterium]